MISRLRRNVFAASLVFAVFAIPAQSQTDPANTLEEHAPPDGPFYPGAPKSSSRLQAPIGDYILRLYGTLLMNISTSDTVQVGQDVPLWPLPGNVNVTFPDGTTRRAGSVGDTIFTARQSILGVQVSPKDSRRGWNPSGLVEIDFFGSRPVDPNSSTTEPRL